MFSSRPVTLLHSSSQIVNNENATAPSKTTTATTTKDPSLTVHKTPAGTKSRRAFGDISNKRPQKHFQEGDEVAWKAAAAPRTPATVILKKSSKKSTKKASDLRFFTNHDTKRGVSFADKLESSKLVVPSVPPNLVSGTDATLKKSVCDEEDLYDEPEKPLGRTYRQQWENGDHDDDETVLSLEGVYTIAKTWKEVDENINLQQPSYEKEFQQRITEFDQELEDFAKKEGAYIEAVSASRPAFL